MDLHTVMAWEQSGYEVLANLIRGHGMNKAAVRHDHRGSGNGGPGRIGYYAVERSSRIWMPDDRSGVGEKGGRNRGSNADKYSILHVSIAMTTAKRHKATARV